MIDSFEVLTRLKQFLLANFPGVELKVKVDKGLQLDISEVRLIIDYLRPRLLKFDNTVGLKATAIRISSAGIEGIHYFGISSQIPAEVWEDEAKKLLGIDPGEITTAYESLKIACCSHCPNRFFCRLAYR